MSTTDFNGYCYGGHIESDLLQMFISCRSTLIDYILNIQSIKIYFVVYEIYLLVVAENN